MGELLQGVSDDGELSSFLVTTCQELNEAVFFRLVSVSCRALWLRSTHCDRDMRILTRNVEATELRKELRVNIHPVSFVTVECVLRLDAVLFDVGSDRRQAD